VTSGTPDELELIRASRQSDESAVEDNDRGPHLKRTSGRGTIGKGKLKTKTKPKPKQAGQSPYRVYKPVLIDHCFIPSLKTSPKLLKTVKTRKAYYKGRSSKISYNIYNFSRIIMSTGPGFARRFKQSKVFLNRYASEKQWNEDKLTTYADRFERCLDALTKLHMKQILKG